MARRDGDAPGWRLELRSGEPTWPNAEAPGREPDSKLSVMGRDLPHSDWKREGDPVATDGEPYLVSDAVGEAPRRDMDACCENELLSLSPWSREKRRHLACGVRRSLKECLSRSSSDLPIISVSSHSSSF